MSFLNTNPGPYLAPVALRVKLPLSIDQGPKQVEQELEKGAYTVRIENPEKKSVNYSLIFSPTRLSSHAPLPPLSNEDIPSPPDFPVIAENTPNYFDLARRQKKSFSVKIDVPALYRLESTGLLETEGNLRTRVNSSLFREANNGTGRNFLIQNYLREGNYQLTVSPRGTVQGHLGVRLSKTKLHAGGILKDGATARFTLPAGEGVLYRFRIQEKGVYSKIPRAEPPISDSPGRFRRLALTIPWKSGQLEEGVNARRL